MRPLVPAQSESSAPTAARLGSGRSGRAVQRVGDGAERPRRVELVGLPFEDEHSSGRGLLQALGQEPGLPDPRLSLDERQLDVAAADPVDRAGEHGQLVCPSDDV